MIDNLAIAFQLALFPQTRRQAFVSMEHHVVHVSSEHKLTVVRELVSGQGRTLAFTRTKHGAKKLAKQLTMAGIPAVELHGNLSQNARERNLEAFAGEQLAAATIDLDGLRGDRSWGIRDEATDDWDDNRRYDRISAWGHQPLRLS